MINQNLTCQWHISISSLIWRVHIKGHIQSRSSILDHSYDLNLDRPSSHRCCEYHQLLYIFANYEEENACCCCYRVDYYHVEELLCCCCCCCCRCLARAWSTCTLFIMPVGNAWSAIHCGTQPYRQQQHATLIIDRSLPTARWPQIKEGDTARSHGNTVCTSCRANMTGVS